MAKRKRRGNEPPVVIEKDSLGHSSDDDDISPYDLLVSSLRPYKRPRVEEKVVEEAGGRVEPEASVEWSGDEEESDREDMNRIEPDPFSVHLDSDLSEEDVASLKQTFSQPLPYQQTKHPLLGCVSEAVCLPSRHSCVSYSLKSLSELHVKQRLATLWSSVRKPTGPFSPLQRHLFAIMNSYKDLLFTQRTFENGEEIREVYLLHALNHVLKTRSRVLKNNGRLARAVKEGREIEVPRDQGLTRPKVLILLPFREAAIRTVNTIISLLLPPGEGEVSHRKRFLQEYSVEEESVQPKIPKPASFQAMFAGNVDDCFRLGIAVRRNVVKLYSEFYSSDIIVASPLGLRTIIGAEGEKSREFDFLSSLELVIVDQSDVFLMQNWDHLTHVFDHLHRQPHDPHGVDFSRVRMWSLDGWGRYYRQTLLMSTFPTPEINALFNKHCYNYAGKLKTGEPSCEGSICQVAVQTPQVFHRIDCGSYSELAEARFTYFIEKVLPEHRGDLMKQTAIFIPSYFDFVRIRNYFKREEISSTQICEYTKRTDITRARSNFFHGRRHFLLLTERAHFFRRPRLLGIHHLVFYSLPLYPEFYPELVNSMEGGDMGCTMLYSHYESLALSRVVGSGRAQRMLAAADPIQMMVTEGQ